MLASGYLDAEIQEFQGDVSWEEWRNFPAPTMMALSLSFTSVLGLWDRQWLSQFGHCDQPMQTVLRWREATPTALEND